MFDRFSEDAATDSNCLIMAEILKFYCYVQIYSHFNFIRTLFVFDLLENSLNCRQILLFISEMIPLSLNNAFLVNTIFLRLKHLQKL